MRPYLKLFSLLCFFGCFAAKANLSARTSAHYWLGDSLIMGPQKLTGSASPHSYSDFYANPSPQWFEALVKRYATPDSLTDFLAVLNPPVTSQGPTSVDVHYVEIDPTAMYDRVEISFDAWSNKKPIRNIRMMAPSSEGFRFDAPRFNGTNREGIAKAILSPKRLSPGTYPVLFVARESGCSRCLTVKHLVVVRIPVPCRRHPVNLACRSQYLERSRIELKTAAIFEYLRKAARDDGHMAEVLDSTTRCGEGSDCAPSVLGECPELALGASAESCAKLRRMQGEWDALFQARAQVDSFFTKTNCCSAD